MCDLAGMLFGRKRDHEPINDIKNGYIISRGEKKRCDGYLPKKRHIQSGVLNVIVFTVEQAGPELQVRSSLEVVLIEMIIPEKSRDSK